MDTSRQTRAVALLAEALAIEASEIPDDVDWMAFDPWDSLGHMRLVAMLEEILKRDLTTDEILELDSLPAIEALIGSD